jgi:hypothetical protein
MFFGAACEECTFASEETATVLSAQRKTKIGYFVANLFSFQSETERNLFALKVEAPVQ